MTTQQIRAIEILSGPIDACTSAASREVRRASAIAAITAGPGAGKFSEQADAFRDALALASLVLDNHYDNGASFAHSAWLAGRADAVRPVLAAEVA